MREKPLHILIIDPSAVRALVIEEGLREAGHETVNVIGTTDHCLRRVVDLDPDVIFIDLENPNRDELEHMFQVSRAVKRPIAMFVDKADQASIEAAMDAGISAYVVDGLKKERVNAILDTAVLRFNVFDRMRRELDEARSELDEARSELANRKAIDRAKAILMKTRGLTEPDAYALLRKTAMNRNKRIVDIAENLIMASGLLKENSS